MKGAFYLFTLQICWQPFMTFSKPVRWRALGINRDGITYLAVCVVPMGWASAVGLCEHAGRNMVRAGQGPIHQPSMYPAEPHAEVAEAGGGLPAKYEIRRDLPFPISGHEQDKEACSEGETDFVSCYRCLWNQELIQLDPVYSWLHLDPVVSPIRNLAETINLA